MHSVALFSDDAGKTWRHGDLVEPLTNENELVELADGRILMSARQNQGLRRFLIISSDGGESWTETAPGQPVSACACAIERFTLASEGDDRNRILWTGPKGPGRKTLIVKVSYDEGKSCPVERLISSDAAAYSDLTTLGDNTAGVLWERGGYQHITFSRFNLAFVESPEPAKQ
jgi:sialidase-1